MKKTNLAAILLILCAFASAVYADITLQPPAELGITARTKNPSLGKIPGPLKTAKQRS